MQIIQQAANLVPLYIDDPKIKALIPLCSALAVAAVALPYVAYRFVAGIVVDIKAFRREKRNAAEVAVRKRRIEEEQQAETRRRELAYREQPDS